MFSCGAFALNLLGIVRISLLFLCAISGTAQAQMVPPTTSSYFTDPVPTEIVSPSEVVLHKELNGYGNYGVADRASDILYTDQAATWHFSLPGSVKLADVQGAFFRTGLIADDHYGVPLNLYQLSVWTDGEFLGNSPAALPHGGPYSSIFTNWAERDYPDLNPASSYTLTLDNTSQGTSGGDWYAVDWIELHFPLAPQAVPEPGEIVVLCTGLTSVLLFSRQRKETPC